MDLAFLIALLIVPLFEIRKNDFYFINKNREKWIQMMYQCMFGSVLFAKKDICFSIKCFDSPLGESKSRKEYIFVDTHGYLTGSKSRFCSGKLGKNINDFESVRNLVKESREEHRKGECTREKCGPLHSYGCAYHLRTDRKE